uniref:Hemoglobin subunit alpha n=1 Tax=Isurus oxyrinchus TaxID=57983 RepID=F2Z286_ISUOX|nr:Chain A, Hemoglobin subunit alpha [Isurus oxyrinchus]3MKB_C Chain C, Hemoglobin subunit alpha [Isurus oxyrinchus]
AFTGVERSTIGAIAKILASTPEAYGAEALARLFATHPGAKSYFDYADYSAAGAKVQLHGGKVIRAVVSAAEHDDDLHAHLMVLAVTHGKKLLVDPSNFPMLSECILVTLATHLAEFSPATHCAVDKLLSAISSELSSKYR